MKKLRTKLPLIKKFLLLALVVFLGFVRCRQAIPQVDENWIQFYNEQGAVALKGFVSQSPRLRGGTQRLILDGLKIFKDGAEKNLKGKISVKTRLYPQFSFGETISVTGKLETAPEFNEFSYKDYLATEGIYSLMNYPQIRKIEKGVVDFSAPPTVFLSSIFSLRKRLFEIVQQLLPEPHSSLLAGILFGFEPGFSSQFYDLFRKAGILHIIVASGFNLSVVVSFLLGITFFIKRRVSLLIALVGMIFYALLTGLEPPILRAMLMAMGALSGEFFGRRYSALVGLFLAAVLMLFYNPLWLFNLSFQLSFAATAAVILVRPLIQKLIVYEHAATTLAVQLFTLPLIFTNFHQVSLASLPVNSLILPLVPLIMGWGMLTVVVGFFSLPLAQILSWPLWLLLMVIIRVAEFFVGLVR